MLFMRHGRMATAIEKFMYARRNVKIPYKCEMSNQHVSNIYVSGLMYSSERARLIHTYSEFSICFVCLCVCACHNNNSLFFIFDGAVPNIFTSEKKKKIAFVQYAIVS